MKLLTPLGLLAALVLPVIVILYMLKKRTRPQVVSSTMLWRRLDRVNQPALRLSKLLRSLLLVLQLLTALLLVLTLARPMLNSLGGVGVSRIILIDTSVSMAVNEGGKTRLEEVVSRLESQIRGKATGDRFALIAMGEEAAVVSGFSADTAILLKALAQVRINSARANPDAGLALAVSMAQAEEEAAIVLYSAGCFGSLARLPEEGLEFIVVGEKEVENLAIENIVPDGDRLYVTIFNNGTLSTSGQVEIRDASGELAGRREVSLEPLERRVLVWRNLLPTPWLEAVVSSPGDQLELDNHRYSVMAEAGPGKLLLISEGNLFLERGLLLYPGLSVTRVAPATYSPAIATKYDIFVFDGFLPEELPAAPILVFDPPHPNQHFATGELVAISGLHPLAHSLLDYVDFSEVSIGFGKAIIGGSGILEFDRGLLASVLTQGGQPLVVFGFAVQGGDLPLRPAFPILLRNILDSFGGSRQPSLAIKYGQKAPSGDITLSKEDGSAPLGPNEIPDAGVFILAMGEREELVAINVPPSSESVAAQSQLEIPGGILEGKASGGGVSLLWPLVLSALILMAVEWRLDNYGG